MIDPFGTAALRAALLTAWESSPTRLREDAALEADLVRAGYRDRVFTELAQNAADAARQVDVEGELEVWLDGRKLHVANTGAPLTVEGVQALSAMRASAKGTVGTVGRFGVGFTAVLACADEVEIRSTSGSICFSAERTRRELAGLLERGGVHRAPVLRLVWPSDARPAAGFDTEVVLVVRDGIDATALLDSARREAVDLLLELPALHRITIADESLERVTTGRPDGLAEIRIGGQTWWCRGTAQHRWLVPQSGGEVHPVGVDVLRAPTRSDEALSLPAILVCDVAMQPDRRRILPGAHVAELASGYGDFVAALPALQRPKLVPVPGLPRGDVDSALREAVYADLRVTQWVPVVGGSLAAPARAAVLPGLTETLAELLADVIPNLVVPELSTVATASVLAQVDAHRLGLARVAELLSGLDRAPAWWGELYDALEALVVDSIAVEELGALPVPLADGRIVTGPRTTVVGVDLDGDAVPVHWARLVHPAANQPLLQRLGARSVSAADLLSDPGLQALIEDVDDDDAADLAAGVLALAARASTELPAWLGLLLLPDDAGELRHADELLLPDAPLRRVLIDESPFGTVDSALVAEFGAEALRAVGVGATFGVVRAELPTGPDHDLDDEPNWWATLQAEPDTLHAVRDLDLVAEERWPEALTMLVTDPASRPQFADRAGYLPWWLRRHARIGGQPLGALRHPADPDFAGLLDVFDHPHVDDLRACLADPRDLESDTVGILLARLADPARTPTPAVVAETHRVLAEAVAADTVDIESIDLPEGVRSMAATVVEPGDAVVLDRPWFALALPPDRLVAGSLATAHSLATLLDLPLASDAVTGTVEGTGTAAAWDGEPRVVLAALAAGIELPRGPLMLHDELRVHLRGALDVTVDVPLWVDEAGTTHLRRI